MRTPMALLPRKEGQGTLRGASAWCRDGRWCACERPGGLPGVFQMNTAVSSFKRLVNSLGTPKDTPELRQKL